MTVVGSANVDLITYAPRMPGAGETVFGDRFQMGFGGKGANQAVMLQLLAADVQMVACVGNDLYGQMTLDNFASYGIDTSHVLVAEDSTGVAPIWVEPNGTNRIIVVPGANNSLSRAHAAGAVAAGPAPTVVVGQLETAQPVTTAAFEAGRARGAVTILNPAPAAAIEPSLLFATDWLIPNEIEFAELTGGQDPAEDAAIHTLAVETASRILITLGAEGAALLTEDRRVVRIPAEPVKAADTTGAGDAFVGGFAYGLAAGWDPIRAATLGIRVASDSVQRPGTQASFPAPEPCARILREM